VRGKEYPAGSVRVSVKEDNASQMILAPKGRTLSDVFAENEITLGARDTADADLTAALTADSAVQITRAKRVFVSADGKRRMEDLNEGTVEDALKAAGITLGENDTVTPAMDTALTNGMRIRVQRYLDLTVTADGFVLGNLFGADAHNADHIAARYVILCLHLLFTLCGLQHGIRRYRRAL